MQHFFLLKAALSQTIRSEGLDPIKALLISKVILLSMVIGVFIYYWWTGADPSDTLKAYFPNLDFHTPIR